MIRILRLALAASTLLALGGCRAPAPAPPAAEAPVPKPATITLALQPTDNAANIQARATELEQFLESTMKAQGSEADIEIYIPLSTAGVVEALRFGHADAAMMSAWPATLASERAGARIVLAEQREVMVGDAPTVGPFYYSYYVVLKDSPYRTLADLKGKIVAYPSQTSTSGYVFPVAKLVAEGLIAAPGPSAAPNTEADPREHFGHVVFAGGYAQAWEALKAGQADVGVTAGDINAKLYAEVLEGTRIIAEQGPIPSHAVVYAKEFTGARADALTRALLELKGEQREIMRKLLSGIFVSFAQTTTEQHAKDLATALEATGFRLQEKL